MSWDDIREIESFLQKTSPGDCMTRRFVGQHLPDLFRERIKVHPEGQPAGALPGRSSRRALIFSGRDLFQWRAHVLRIMEDSVREEPHILWQFVLHPGEETPLDLLERMIFRLKGLPLLWIDRLASVSAGGRIASRRIFVLLQPNVRYSRSWVKASETLLGDHFF
jgi:hypothetical protein